MDNNMLHRGISIKTQYWLFKKQRINSLLLLVFLFAGTYGLYQGFAFKNKQVTVIDTFRKDKIAALEGLKSGFLADTAKPEGKAAYSKATSARFSNYNIVLPAYKMPTSTAIFNIGQADIFPYYYTIKNESFFMQLFKQAEIANPLRSLAGHFDISFWIIYLLPLLITILCFNALPAELDNGNWKLISSQGVNAQQWLLSKFLLIGLLLFIMVLLIFCSGLAINYWYFKQTPALSDFLFLLAANLYLVFWLSLVYAINAYSKNSSGAALYSGIAWIAICFIIPALVTTVIEKSISVDNTVVSRMSRRPQGSQFEDSAFRVQTIRKLGELRPQYKNVTLQPTSSAAGVGIYLAYHELMDDTNIIAVQGYFRNIESRQQITNASCLLNPASGTDGLFANLAANDAVANHAFIWRAKAFHQKLHDAYFPSVFFDRLLTKNDYDKFPVFKYQPVSIQAKIVINYFMLLLLTAIIIFVGNKRLRTR